MPTDHILSMLITERDKLNAAISLLGGTPTKRRGRPPKSTSFDLVNSNGAAAPPARKKRTFSAAQRKEQAARMKKYWANKRKEAGKK